MEHLIKAIVSVAAIWLVGYASVLFFLKTRPVRNASLGFTFGLGFGFGLLAEYGLLSLALTGRIDFRFVYAAAILAASLIIYAKRGKHVSLLSFRANRRNDMQENTGRAESLRSNIVAAACKVVIAIVALVVTFNLLARPLYSYDARAIWGLKAKILFHEKTIFSESVEDISRNHPHPRYPLLIPIASAWVFENLGEADDRAVRFVFLMFFVGLIAATFQLQKEHGGRRAGLVSLAVLLSVPFVYAGGGGGASSGYADTALSFYITASALAILFWIKEGSGFFLAAGALFAAFAALTKNEGLVFAGNLFLTTAAFILLMKDGNMTDGVARIVSREWLQARRSKLSGLGVYVCVVVVALLPWVFVRSGLPKFLDENYASHFNWGDISTGLTRLPTIIKLFGIELLEIRNWGIIWILVAAAACMAWRQGSRESRFLSVLIVLQLASYLAVFVITPFNFVGQMEDSMPRLLLHVLPLGVTLLSFQIAGTESADTTT